MTSYDTTFDRDPPTPNACEQPMVSFDIGQLSPEDQTAFNDFSEKCPGEDGAPHLIHGVSVINEEKLAEHGILRV